MMTADNEKGMALLLTLLIVSLVSILTIQLNDSMLANLQGAANLGDSVRLDYTAKSAFNLSRALLTADSLENGYDTLHENWANIPFLAASAGITTGSTRVDISVEDLSGKIQVNALVEEKNGRLVPNEAQILLMKNFLSAEVFELDEERSDEIIQSIIDWIDDNDELSGLWGAENNYYLALEKPYPCKNGPIESVNELLLIRGVTPELFYGNDKKPGIANYLTSLGNDGKININTADPFILEALNNQIDREVVASMIAYRNNPENDLSDPLWYKKAPLFPGDVEITGLLLTTSSNYFSVLVTAGMAKMNKSINGTIKRTGNGRSAVVAWKVE